MTSEQQHVLDLLEREIAKARSKLIAATSRVSSAQTGEFTRALEQYNKLDCMRQTLEQARDILRHHYVIQENRKRRR